MSWNENNLGMRLRISCYWCGDEAGVGLGTRLVWSGNEAGMDLGMRLVWVLERDWCGSWNGTGVGLVWICWCGLVFTVCLNDAA